ncbi:MAG: hypothetical protein KIT73_14160, partial [Burkholderiales bacterium]|nr:hypothetical protein [Burkholderiales bacterium]
MIATPESIRAESEWQPRDREAELVTALLRLSRLTLLYGAPCSGKTLFCQYDLLPRLNRRDVREGAEIAVHFEGWGAPALEQIGARIRQALIDAGARLP